MEMEEEKETGRDRVQALFSRRAEGEGVAEEIREFQATVLVGTLTGFLLGGLVGARYSGDKFVMLSHSAKFSSTMQAQRELHSAALLGFVRNGCRWGWKVGVFSGMFSGSTILLSTYRDRSDALNYIAAGAVSGCLFRARAGLKPAVGGLVLGTLLSIPVSVVLHSLERLLVSKEEREKIRRDKYLSRRGKVEQWEERLSSTTELIEGLERELEEPRTGPLHNTYAPAHPLRTSSAADTSPDTDNSITQTSSSSNE